MLLTDYSFRKVDNTTINYRYAYDVFGRQIQMTYPADVSGAVRTESYRYDIANHLDQYTNPAGQVKALSYDSRGRLTNTSWSANGPSVTIGYDATRPTSITSSQGGATTTIGFGYDEANNRIYEDQTISGLPTRRVQTDPDADGNRTDLLVKTGSTVNFANYFDYTSRNELLNIYDNSHAAFFKYSYDASGNVTERLGQRLHDSTVLTYDALNRPITCAQNGLNASNFSTSHYDYDKLGNLQDTYRDEEGGKGERFGYDGLNQVATAYYSATNVTSGTPQNPTKTVSYSVGARNRRSMTVTDNILNTTTTTTYTNIDLNQISSIQVGSSPAQPLRWDSNLNLSSYNGWSYSYDAENRLISVSGNGHSGSFVYDGIGRCVKRVLDGVTTVITYDRWTSIAEWDGSGNLIATNVYGLGDDEIMYRSAGSTQLFYKSDPMGNVKCLLDQNGRGIEKYKYDAFGQPTITDWSGNSRANSAFGNRFMFGGRDYMLALVLYDMRNRMYDPVMGRFYQIDPISFDGDPLNLYRFCGNNPLLGGDPMGLDGFLGIDWGGIGKDILNFVIDANDAVMSLYYNGNYSPSGSSDAAVSATADWWGDPVNDSVIPWGAQNQTSGTISFTDAVVVSKGTDFKLTTSRISLGDLQVAIGSDLKVASSSIGLRLAGPSVVYFASGYHGISADAPLGDMILLAGGLRTIHAAGSMMAAESAATAETRMVTVLGSRRDVAPYVGRPGFNVFDFSKVSTEEIPRVNAKLLNSALRHGDEIWLVTNPVKHAELMKELGLQSYYLDLELPMLEQYGGRTIPRYAVPK